ncbi:uncharacterized protein [Zea mays]|uniref:uncharacterized protein n=1 Tax=Zea mays TaxID=4577 RepID=UPI0016527268|nr:uncharacterized protein LOC103650738 [Zea mays]
MEKLDHNDMTIRAGPGKDLKIIKDTVHLILGLPNAGGGTALGIDEAVAANNLRAELGLSKEDFGVAALQDRLRKGWGITNHEVLLTEEMDRFHQMDWCQLYYLDHLHDSAAPQNKRGTPQIKYFDRNIIQALTRADKGKIRKGEEPFGHCSHTIHIELPLIRDLISSKLNQLPSRHRLGFIEKLSHFDTEVGKACSVIKQTLQQIVEKQYNLSDVFGELIDEVLRAESGDNEDGYDVQKTTSKSDDILPQTAKSCPDEADIDPLVHTNITKQNKTPTTPVGKHGDGGKNMPTNTNVTPKATPHMEPDAPIFDATPQIKSTGGVQQAAETDLPDSGPCFDQTPSEHVSVETDPATNTPQVGQASLDSEMQTVLALREYLCGLQSDTSRTIIDYGEYSATCSDIYESFADGKCLDNVFMQCFIQCVFDDAKNQQTSMSSNSLILDVNVGSLLNFEEQERHSRNPQPFDESVLHTLLDNSLPETDELDQCSAGNTSEIRSLALHYITFHPKNKALSLLEDIQRFKV